MEICKRDIFRVLLFILFFPLLGFDIFLFHDDGAGDFGLIGKLWLITFLISFIYYLYKQKITTEKSLLYHMIELIFVSFVVLFFVANLFLVGMFVWIANTSNQFLI